MLQLLFIYYALPLLPGGGIQLPDFPAAVVAFVLNYAAYFAEIFRPASSRSTGASMKGPRCWA